MSVIARVEDPAATADPGLEALIASWTGERPSPEYWIETRGTLRARTALEEALRAGAAAILVMGPSGHGKTTLLRSLWHHPPSGFATVFVPSLDVSEPNQIAARILATTRSGEVHDAAGALSRLLRAQALRGLRPVLLVDDLDEMAPATLARLLALSAASRVDVSVVAAGSKGEALDALRRALPRPVRKIAIDDPWTRADAERLIARIGASLPIGAADVLAAIDVPEALRTSRGNPRLVRAALAAQLRQLNLSRIEPVIPPPESAAPSELASSEPVASQPALPAIAAPPDPAPAAVAAPNDPVPAAAAVPPAVPFTALVATPATPLPEISRSAPSEVPPRSPPCRAGPQQGSRPAHSRVRRRRLSTRARLRISGALVASIAFMLLVDRGPAIAAWSAATAGAYAADTVRWIASWTPEISAAPIAEAISAYASAHLRRVTEWKPSEVAAPGLARTEPQPTAPHPTAPAPIRVAVNSDPWSNVEVDGVEAGSTPLTIELAPGRHSFRAAMADGRVVEKEIEVTADRNRVALR